MNMKVVLSLLACVFFTLSHAQKNPNKFLPASVRKTIHFEMTEYEYVGARSKDQYDFKDDTFRHVFIENVENDPAIESVVLYFDQDGDKKLYEVILIFKEETKRDAYAVRTLGQPNTVEGEWVLKHKKRPDVNAWKFKNKLVLVLKIPGCEWDD